MAINIPIITEFADQGLKSAQGAFSTFRSKVAEAEGGMGKFKAGAGVALDTVKANAAGFAAAAGGAIATFAVNAINDFKDLALSVDEFRNKTDLTLEQSSKWVSYSGDLGVEADVITKIFSRLAKAATDEIPAFEELGVAIALGEDGSTDIEETFFRVNEAINSLEDPVAEAAYRADLYGKGWMNAAEIIQMSSSDIRTALDGVKDFEVIDEDEIEKAKDLRAAQDELGDAFARLSVTIGENLIPALTKGLEALIPFLEAAAQVIPTLSPSEDLLEMVRDKYDELGASVSDVVRSIGGLDQPDALNYVMNIFQMTADEVYRALDKDLIPATWLHAEAVKEGARSMIEAYEAGLDLEVSMRDVDEALDELTGNINERKTFRRLQDSIEDAQAAAIRAFQEATPQALRRSEDALDDAKLKVAEYISEIDEIPPDKKTDFIAMIDAGGLAEVEKALDLAARARAVAFYPTVSGVAIAPGETPSEVLGRNRMATLSAVRPMSGGVTLNVQGSVVTEGDLLRSIRQGLANSQKSGNSLVYSNT